MTHRDNTPGTTPADPTDPGDWTVTRCPLIDPGDLVWLRPVQPGDPAAIVAALRTAQTMADALRDQLAHIGGGAQDTIITPCLNDEGHPIVRVRMTLGGALSLRRWLSAGGGADPPDVAGAGAGDTHAA